MKVSKNSKYQTHKKSIKLTKNPNDRTGALKEGTFSDFLTTIVAKHQKIEGDPLGKFFRKQSQCRKNLKGILWGFFSTSFLSPSIKKL